MVVWCNWRRSAPHLRALDRLEELALEAAGNAPVDVAVAHLDARDRAERLATSLSDELLGLQGREVVLAEVGAVLGAHVGPGMVAVTVSRR
ncbi:MAG: DegV family protein [Marmoricola sp.]